MIYVTATVILNFTVTNTICFMKVA